MKKMALRLYNGFAITMILDLIVHYIVARIMGSCVTPAFAARIGNEASATLLQLMLVALIGMTFAGAGVIFEIERWSFLQQGIVHFAVTAAIWVPVVYFCWFPVSGKGLGLTILGWVATYAVTWGVQYCLYRRRVWEVNRCIQEFNK